MAKRKRPSKKNSLNPAKRGKSSNGPTLSRQLDSDPEVSTKLHRFMMKTMKDYLLGGNSKKLSTDEKRNRRSSLAKTLDRTEQTLKNMYLYGQGDIQQWFTAMDFILKTNQKDIIDFYKAHPYIMEKLSTLGSAKLKMYKNMEQMTDQELELINDLVEVGLERNRAIKLGERAIKKS